jgi:hypothetical protein
LRVNEDESIELVDYKQFAKERQVEIELHLSPGKYVILPRTTGILMSLKPDALKNVDFTPLVDQDGELSKVFEGVIEDIFRKFDLFIGRELSYDEFKIFY